MFRCGLRVGLLVLAASCSTDDATILYDAGIPEPDQIGCFELSQCIVNCVADAGSDDVCTQKCRAKAVPASATLYDALANCIMTTCDGAEDDAGTGICTDASSIECMRCRTNAQFKTAAECTDAPSYCGACATQQAACRAD